MKRLLALWTLILGLPFTASAYMPPPGVQIFFPRADSVYLARVTTTDGEKVSFAVTETLRGNPQQSLRLRSLDTKERPLYLPNTEWLLVSLSPKQAGQANDIVQILLWEFEPWIARSVTRENGKVYVHDYEVQTENGPLPGTEFMTLDRIRQLLAERPYKP